jgi:hypothetical protein
MTECDDGSVREESHPDGLIWPQITGLKHPQIHKLSFGRLNGPNST